MPPSAPLQCGGSLGCLTRGPGRRHPHDQPAHAGRRDAIGEVRHSTQLPSGAKRVGLEFTGISESEEQLLALLLGLVEVP